MRSVIRPHSHPMSMSKALYIKLLAIKKLYYKTFSATFNFITIHVPYTEICCYSPDSWFVIAQLIKCNKLSLRLHHHTTNRAHKFVTSIVSTGSLQQTKLCAFAMKASSCYASQT
jgi:hypothetical protein